VNAVVKHKTSIEYGKLLDEINYYFLKIGTPGICLIAVQFMH